MKSSTIEFNSIKYNLSKASATDTNQHEVICTDLKRLSIYITIYRIIYNTNLALVADSYYRLSLLLNKLVNRLIQRQFYQIKISLTPM